jgi:hypothetical protein
MPQGFPDILEIVKKSRSGVKPCDNLKFSENHRRCQPHGCGKCGDRIRAIGKGNMPQELTERFSSVITEEDKEILLREARTASGWIYKEIRNICGGRPS